MPDSSPDPNPIAVPERGLKVSWALGIVGCLGALLCAAAGIIAPILSSAGQSVQSEQCMDNLRRLSKASFLYAEENSGVLPGEGWDETLYSIEPEDVTYACPSQRRLEPKSSGYALSRDVADQILDKIGNQYQTPLFFDSRVIAMGAVASPADVPKPGRHRTRRANNVAYVDGHVASVNLP